ncbi:universal stress protein [Rhizohabitans arisaemae]|uniref:universal stress protein n=1 Tax=Rhizohabitans arisaemae TaxID=2720610 RepID=UPI0024B19CB2|nr:universal stress protein [Rhizohabitans arisaemae]
MKIQRILVGYEPDARGHDALALAAVMARTVGAEVTVASVHSAQWPTPSKGRVDAEWQLYLRENAQRSVDEAAGLLSTAGLPHPVAKALGAHRGSGRGLVELAGRIGADLVVIGSAPRGRRRRISVGSTADQLLHASPVPVALAPRGYAGTAPESLERLTVAYRRDARSDAAVVLAGAAAERYGLRLRLLTLLVRERASWRGRTQLMSEWHARCDSDLRAVVPSEQTECEVAHGSDVGRALGSVDWLPGELLVCASSGRGPIRKVFIGDVSSKILRSAPCPVLILSG